MGGSNSKPQLRRMNSKRLAATPPWPKSKSQSKSSPYRGGSERAHPFCFLSTFFFEKKPTGPFFQSPQIHSILLINQIKKFRAAIFSYSSFNMQQTKKQTPPTFLISLISLNNKNKSKTKKFPGLFFSRGLFSYVSFK